MAWYDGLSAEQKKVVGCDSEKSIRLLAGPGTGKTKCLIHRVAYLEEKKSTKNQDIVAITFTRAAANEIRERLIKELKNPYLHWQFTPESIHAVILNIGYMLTMVAKTFKYHLNNVKCREKQCLRYPGAYYSA